MGQTIYATFDDPTKCEQAAGALLDFGVRNEDLSIVVNTNEFKDSRVAQSGYRGGSTRSAVLDREDLADAPPFDTDAGTSRTGSFDRRSYGTDAEAAAIRTENARTAALYPDTAIGAGFFGERTEERYDNGVEGPIDEGVDRTYDDTSTQSDIESAAKTGISVTTGEDAAAGAAKGAGWGLGIGVLAGLAALAVPGVGLVLGGGALASAIGLALGATAAGAASGGVVGYFKDQGVPQHAAATYDETVRGGGAIIAVMTPSNGVDARTAEELLRKYGAVNVSSY